MHGQNGEAAEAAIKRRQYLSEAVCAPDQGEHAAGFQNSPARVNPALKRRSCGHMRGLASSTPAPKPTTRSPERPGVAAASSMASWPARCPDFGCRRRNCPPRNASSVNSPGSVIGPQFVAEACISKNLARLAVIVLMDQDPARQDSEGTFDNAHVLIQHQMMDIGAIEQRANRRNQHHVVGPNQFPQL